MGEIILIASGKGGTGKTTFAVNIAGILAEQGYKTIVLDFNVGLRNADIYMGLENNVIFDLGDVVSGVCNLDKAIVRSYRYPGLDLLCSPQYKEIEGFGAEHINALYGLLRARYDYILVDAPSGMGKYFHDIANGVNASLLLLTLDHLSLRSADAVDKRLENLGISRRFCAVNLVDPEVWGNPSFPDINSVTKILSCPLAGIVRSDSAIHIANNDGTIAALNGNEHLHHLFRSIALQLISK